MIQQDAVAPGLTMKQKSALFFATIFIFTNIYSPQAILPQLAQEYHQSTQAISWVLSLPLILIATFSLVYGRLSDRFGRRTIMRWATLGLVFPTFLCSVAPSYSVLLVLRALQGILLPGFMSMVISYVNDIFPPGERGAGMGIFAAATAVSAPLGRIQVGFLSEYVDWKAGFLSFGLSTFIAWLLISRFLPDEPKRLASMQVINHNNLPPNVRFDEKLRRALLPFWRHLHNPHLSGAYIVGAAMQAGFMSLLTYLPFRLSHAPYDLNGAQISLIYVVYLLGAFVAPRAGFLSDRYGRKLVLGIALSVMIIGLWITLSQPLGMILLGLALAVVGLFSVQSTATSLIGDWATQDRGAATALYTLFYYVGAGLGTSFNAFVWVHAAWMGIVVVCSLFLICALLAVRFLC